MIHSVSGDILLSKCSAIAHGIAPGDHFNQGLALALRERWPSLYKDFRHYCQVSHPKPGTLWSWRGAGGPLIVSLFTQEPPQGNHSHPGKATASHVHHCLRELRKLVEEERVTSIALPRLATGVGGLEWETVEPLISGDLGELAIPVVIYTVYQKDVHAKEPV